MTAGSLFAKIRREQSADAIGGDDAGFRIMADVAHRDFPGGPMLRRPLVTLGRLWYRLLDHF